MSSGKRTISSQTRLDTRQMRLDARVDYERALAKLKTLVNEFEGQADKGRASTETFVAQVRNHLGGMLLSAQFLEPDKKE